MTQSTRPPAQDAKAAGDASAPQESGGEGIYSIRLVSKLTGVSLDTLRVWERRYGFPKPARRDSGSRLYTQLDVDTLIVAGKAMAAGYRPSEVLGKSLEELQRLVGLAPPPAAARGTATAGPGVTEPAATVDLDEFIRMLQRGDAGAMQDALRRSSLLLGPRRFMSELVHPLSVRVGAEWEAGALEVHQEHLASALLSAQLQLLSSAFEGRSLDPVVLMTTLPGELHALGLEMAVLGLHLAGATPRSFGPNTPVDQIVKAAVAQRAHVVGISTSVAAATEEVTSLLQTLRQELPRGIEVWVGGGGARALTLQAPDLYYAHTVGEIESRVRAVRAKLHSR